MTRRLVIVLDVQDLQLLARFWSNALDYEQAPSEDPYAVLSPKEGNGPELVLQRVDEPKAAKNRMHMDIRTDHRAQEIPRLLRLGAVRTGAEYNECGCEWEVLQDPEGNEFCVCTESWS